MLAIGERLGTLAEVDDGHAIVLHPTEVELAIRIWNVVKGWKGATLRVGGEEADGRTLAYKGLGCFRERRRHPPASGFCSGTESWNLNRWGCFRLGLRHEDVEWLEVMEAREDGGFALRKDRIGERFGAREKEFRHCPCLDASKADRAVRRLPDVVHPSTDRRWAFVERLLQALWDEQRDSGPDDVDAAEDSGANAGIVKSTGKHVTAHIEEVKSLKRAGRHEEAIRLLRELVEADAVRADREDGGLAPWYTEQLAIVLRKEGRYAEEVEVLEAYDRRARVSGVDSSAVSLRRRLAKARGLLVGRPDE